MDLQNHLRQFETICKLQLPDSYLCFDCETTGYRIGWDLPIELGYMEVRNRQPQKPQSILLDWSNHPLVENEWLQDILQHIFGVMRGKGAAGWNLTYDYLRQHGVPAEAGLRQLGRVFLACRRDNIPMVGHNAWSFDAPVLESCFKDFCGVPFVFGENEIYDSGCMEKAAALQMLPKPGESLKRYFLRVRNRPHAFKWGIEACAVRYKFIDNKEAAASSLHQADSDSLMCHMIFEKHRSLIEDD